MRYYISLLASTLASILLLSVELSGQETDTLEDYITRQFIAEEYKSLQIIGQEYPAEDLSAMSLYYIGLAHFKQDNDEEAASFLDQAVIANPFYSDFYYYRGMIYFFSDSMDKALEYFSAAIKLKPREPDYYEALGEVYLNLGDKKQYKAMLSKALELKGVRDDVYLKMADYYLGRQQTDSALEIYYDCLYHAAPSSSLYLDCLYNIGYFEYEKGNYQDAELSLNTLLSKNPDDFQARQKLLQVYFAMKKEEPVKALRKDLYKAYIENDLPDGMKYKFCFDQFTIMDYKVKAFEYFAEPQLGQHYKHVFFILNDDDEVLYTIQTEQNEIIKTQDKDYFISMIKDGKKYMFYELNFKGVINYEDLEKAVKKVIREKAEPSRIFDIPEEEQITR